MGDRDTFTSPGLNSLTYPKFLLFMFAVLPQFVVPVAGPVWLQLPVLGSIQKRAGMVSLGSVAMASGMFVNGPKHPGVIQWQERCTGVVIRMMFSGAGIVSTSAR